MTTSGAQSDADVTGLANGDFAFSWTTDQPDIHTRLYSNSAPVPTVPPSSLMSGSSSRAVEAGHQAASRNEMNVNEAFYQEDDIFLLNGNGRADLATFSRSAYRSNVIETIDGFNPLEGDKLDFSRIFGSHDDVTKAIDAYFLSMEVRSNTYILIDADGAGKRYDFQTVAALHNTNNVRIDELIASGDIIV